MRFTIKYQEGAPSNYGYIHPLSKITSFTYCPVVQLSSQDAPPYSEDQT